MLGDAQSAALTRSALVCVLFTAALFYGPYLLRVDLFSDDVSHHIFWLYRYADPALFPDDLSVRYFMTSAPWGYRAIYASLAPFVDVLQTSKWLSVLLFVGSAMLAWKIGTTMAGHEHERALLGLLAVVAFCVLLAWARQRDLLAPIAFQRAFAMPLLLLTLWALLSRRYAWVGVSWLAAALIYPVMLPVQGLTVAVVFLRDLFVHGRMPAHWILNAVLGGAALAIAAFGMPVPPDIGPAYTYREAMLMPEFQPGGRLALHREGILDWTRNHRTGLGWGHHVLALMGLSAALAWCIGRFRYLPVAACAMGIVGVALWGAMRLFPEQLMFDLYLPNRHSRWALGAFGVVAIAGGAATLIDLARRRWSIADPNTEGTLRLWLALVAPLVVTAAILPDAWRVLNTPVDDDLEQTYAYIASLPKDTLVAAHPELADFIPIRSRRSVLTSTEISMAWMHGYYQQMKPRVEASLRAAYATRIEDMDAALQPFAVDVMVTGPLTWQQERYFKPFDSLVEELMSHGERAGFALKNPPTGRVLFQSGEYFVLRVGGCEGSSC